MKYAWRTGVEVELKGNILFHFERDGRVILRFTNEDDAKRLAWDISSGVFTCPEIATPVAGDKLEFRDGRLFDSNGVKVNKESV